VSVGSLGTVAFIERDQPGPGREQPGDQLMRVVYADQFPAGHDLAQAARDSLIRYSRRFGVRYDSRTIHVQHGTKWSRCQCTEFDYPHAHQARGMIAAVRITADVVGREDTT